MSTHTFSSPHFLSIPTFVRENKAPIFPAMKFTSLQFSNTPFLLLPPTLFKCFCSSTTTNSTSLPIDKWEPFLKKKVVMRVGYVGTDYRGCSILFFILLFLICFLFPFYFWDFMVIWFSVLFTGLQMQRNEHKLSSKTLLYYLVDSVRKLLLCLLVSKCASNDENGYFSCLMWFAFDLLVKITQ